MLQRLKALPININPKFQAQREAMAIYIYIYMHVFSMLFEPRFWTVITYDEMSFCPWSWRSIGSLDITFFTHSSLPRLGMAWEGATQKVLYIYIYIYDDDDALKDWMGEHSFIHYPHLYLLYFQWLNFPTTKCHYLSLSWLMSRRKVSKIPRHSNAITSGAGSLVSSDGWPPPIKSCIYTFCILFFFFFLNYYLIII